MNEFCSRNILSNNAADDSSYEQNQSQIVHVFLLFRRQIELAYIAILIIESMAYRMELISQLKNNCCLIFVHLDFN